MLIPLLLMAGGVDALLLLAQWGAEVVGRRQRAGMESQWAIWRAEKARRRSES
ncbi:MAG: hypothetical protein ACYCZN_13140 [Candidatus Dormibacteria bacterium]